MFKYLPGFVLIQEGAVTGLLLSSSVWVPLDLSRFSMHLHFGERTHSMVHLVRIESMTLNGTVNAQRGNKKIVLV